MIWTNDVRNDWGTINSDESVDPIRCFSASDGDIVIESPISHHINQASIYAFSGTTHLSDDPADRMSWKHFSAECATSLGVMIPSRKSSCRVEAYLCFISDSAACLIGSKTSAGQWMTGHTGKNDSPLSSVVSISLHPTAGCYPQVTWWKFYWTRNSFETNLIGSNIKWKVE